MKYWLLTTEYPPFFGGGISTYCYFTAQMLTENGHEVSVFVNDTAVEDFQVTFSNDIRIIRFHPARTRSLSFLGHVTNISYEFAEIVKEFIVREGKPDILESQEYQGIAYFLLQYKYLLYPWCKDLKVLITMHSPAFLYMTYNHVPVFRYPNYWIGEMERFCLQAADILVSPSRFLLEEVGKRFTLHNNHVSVVPNPFRAETAASISVKTEGANQIVFFGKLSAQKGIFRLLEYFNRLWSEGFSRPLYLIGGQDIVYHPEGKTMGDLIRKHHRSYIDKGLLLLEDKIEPSGIAARLSHAGLVIVPSYKDNLPYVVFEMMALGKLVLVSKQGGHAEVIEDGINGFVFDHDLPGSFESQLKKILALPASATEKIRMEAGRTVAEKYNLNEIYRQKMQVIGSTAVRTTNLYPFIRPLPQQNSNSITDGGKLLSIVVPFYNMGTYLQETIASLMAVDYTEREVLIINDGSTDARSLEILDAYRGVPGILVFDIPNGGLAHARNFGAARAKGTYLAFLDADDLVDASYYSKSIGVLRQYTNVHFVGAWTKYFENSKKTWPTFTPEPPLILYHNLVNSSGLVYKRSSFLASGRNDGNLAHGLEDYESVVSMIAAGNQGVVLPETLFHYRVRSHSMVRGISKARKLLLAQYISEKHNQFYGRFATDLFNLMNANGAGSNLDNPSLDYHLAEKIPFGGKLASKIIFWVKNNRYARNIAYRVYSFINK